VKGEKKRDDGEEGEEGKEEELIEVGGE